MSMKHYAPNRCEPSIVVIMKMGSNGGLGGQGGCERRIEVFVKSEKNSGGGGGRGATGESGRSGSGWMGMKN